METATRLNWSHSRELIPKANAAISANSSSANRIPESHVTSESTEKQEEGGMVDGDRRRTPIEVLLSSKELPSWATRRTVPVLPNNSHVITECQGCIKGQGIAHVCGMKEIQTQTQSDIPPDPYPSTKQATMPQRIVNPYSWSEDPDLCPPSYRPTIPDRRLGDSRNYVCYDYERRYHDDYDRDVHNQCHHFEVSGRQFTHEAPRGIPPTGVYVTPPNLPHDCNVVDSGYMRGRLMMDHTPFYHPHSVVKFPQAPVPLDQSLAPGEWQGISLQNFFLNEPLQNYPEHFFNVPRPRGEWPPMESGRATTGPYTSTENIPCLPPGKDGHRYPGGTLNFDMSAEYSRASTAEENQKKALRGKTKTIEKPTDVVLSKEIKIDFTEKFATAIIPNELSKPAIKPTETNETVSPTADKNDSTDTEINRLTSDNDNISEQFRKTQQDQQSTGEIDPEDIKPAQKDRETELPRPIKPSCAFVIDLSATDAQSIQRLPSNLAQRAEKLSRRSTKDIKPEKQITSSIQHKKPTIGFNWTRKSTEDRENSFNSNFKFLKSKVPMPSADDDDYNDDDDDDDDLDSYREKWTCVKPKSRPDEIGIGVKSFSSKHDGCKFSGIVPRTTSMTSASLSSSSSPSITTTTLSSNKPGSAKPNDGKFFMKMDREVLDNMMISSSEIKGSLMGSGSSETLNNNPTTLSSSFQNRREHKKRAKMANFDSSDDGDVSETETYTIKAAESNAEALAARQKIDLLFGVGLDSRNDSDDVAKDDDDDNDDDDDEAGKKDEVPNTPTAIRPTVLKSSSLKVKLKQFMRTGNLIVHRIKRDEDAGMTGGHATTDDSTTKIPESQERKLDETTTTSGPASSTTSRPSSSSRRRLLPFIPTGRKDTADAPSLTSRSIPSGSHRGDPDPGFVEVVTSGCSRLILDEQKTNGKTEYQTREDCNQRLEMEGQFETIGITPRVRNTENSALYEAKDSSSFQRQSIVRRSWNKICSAMTSKAPPGGIRNLMPSKYDDSRTTAPVTRTTGDDYDDVVVDDGNPPVHNRIEMSSSLPRVDENSYFNKEIIERPMKPSGDDPVKPSKARPRLEIKEKDEEQTDVKVEFSSASSSVKSQVESDGRRPPDNLNKSHGLGEYSSKKPRENSINREPNTGSSHTTVNDFDRKQKFSDSNNSRPPLSSSHRWNARSRAPVSDGPDETQTGVSSRAPEGRRRSTRPPLTRGDEGRLSLRLPRKQNSDANLGGMNRKDGLRSSLRNLRGKESDLENPKFQSYHERMRYDPKKSIMEARKSNRVPAGSKTDDAHGSCEGFLTHRQTTTTTTRGGCRSALVSRTTSSRTVSDFVQKYSTMSSNLEMASKEGTAIQDAPSRESIRNLSDEIEHMLQRFSNKINSPVVKVNTSEQADTSSGDPELQDLLNTLFEVKQVLKTQIQS